MNWLKNLFGNNSQESIRAQIAELEREIVHATGPSARPGELDKVANLARKVEKLKAKLSPEVSS